MLDLAQKQENFTIPLLGEISVVVRPLTTESMLAAQTAAQRKIRELIEPYEECKKSGLIPAAALDCDLSDPDVLEGLRVRFLIEEMAIRHIVSWENVLLDGKPAPVEPEMVAVLMRRHPVGQTFYHEMTIHQVESFLAKKDGGAAVIGTSAVAPNIAKAAGKTTAPVPEGSAGQAENSAPTPNSTFSRIRRSRRSAFWDFFSALY